MVGSIASSSLTALNAYSTMLNNTANNVANMNTGDYAPLETILQESSTGGVTASTIRPSTADRVDISQEAVNRIISENGFKANIAVIRTSQEMEKSIIDLIA